MTQILAVIKQQDRWHSVVSWLERAECQLAYFVKLNLKAATTFFSVGLGVEFLTFEGSVFPLFLSANTGNFPEVLDLGKGCRLCVSYFYF